MGCDDLAHTLGHALARPEVERHAGPAPGVDGEFEGGIGLDPGIRRDARLVGALSHVHALGLLHRDRRRFFVG